MNNNKILSDSDNKNVEAKKPKRVEWLNVYAKGFIVESINNNYKNQNISIKLQNKKRTKNKNINPRNLNSIISTYSKQGIKSNKTIISNSNLSSKKTNFSHIIDEDDDFYSQNKFLITNLNHIFSENVTIKKDNKKQNKIGLKKNISNKNIKAKNNKNIVENKFEKSNSVKNIITARTQRKKNINKKIKKIVLKKDISSPLINYLDFRKKNMNKNIFTQINKKKKNKINKNNSFIHFGTNTLVIDKENNKNKKRFSSPKDEKEELDEIEIQKYMVEGRKYKKYKDKYGFDINCASNRGDYSFDDEKDLYSF